MRILHVLTTAAVVGVAAVAATSAGAVSGGATLPIEQAPWVVSISGSCTGTLISPTRVLTAGHCLDGRSITDASVIVGGDPHLMTGAQRAAATVPVAGFSVAPRYRESFPFSHDNPTNAIAIDDVGLITLKRPITKITPLRVAGVADTAAAAAGTAETLIGYGQTETPIQLFKGGAYKGIPTLPLQQGAVTALSQSACGASYPRAILASMLCTQDLVHAAAPGLVQACPGDSGGPIVATTPAGPLQIGITSWGPEVMNHFCAAKNLPNVAMRVSSYTSFITAAHPPIEPYTLKPGTSAAIVGKVNVGRTVSCQGPKKLGGPPAKLSYSWFLNQGKNPVVGNRQHLTITRALYDRQTNKGAFSLGCTVVARNAGGSLSISAGGKNLHP